MQSKHFVICFIVRPAGATHEFLIARRGAGRYLDDTWQLISGSIEPEETAWQAAIREVREETQLVARRLYALSPIASFYRAQDDAHCTGFPFAAFVDADADVTLNSENTAYMWQMRSELPRHLMWPNDRAIFAYLCDQILDNGPAEPYLRVEL